MYARRNVDPKLESLRLEIDGPPNLDTLTLFLRKASSNIHAGFLFEHVGKPTLQKICLSLSATASGKIYSGWQEFAAHLGLTPEQIRCIDYDFKGPQDPTYYVLLAYVQHPQATLDKVINILQNIGRLDVINEIKGCVKAMISHILKNRVVNETGILRPANVPRVPLVLSLLIELTDSSEENQLRENDTAIAHSLPEGTPNSELITASTQVEQKYRVIIMLTFAEDGCDNARLLTKRIRSRQEKIGVLVLQEQERYVYSRAEDFIDDCFNQVHYIVPILTKGYLTRISSSTDTYIETQSNLDVKYLKYMYSLMKYEYVRKQCRNYRVRCIVPDKQFYTIQQANFHPMLQAWFKESDIESFIDNILLQNSKIDVQ